MNPLVDAMSRTPCGKFRGALTGGVESMTARRGPCSRRTHPSRSAIGIGLGLAVVENVTATNDTEEATSKEA